MEHKLVRVENNDPDITYIISLHSTDEEEQQMILNYLLQQPSPYEKKFIEAYCYREFNKKQFYLVEITPQLDIATIRLEFVKSG